MQTEGKMQTADGKLLSVILFSRSEPQRKSSNFTGNAIPTSQVNVFNRTSHTSPVVESNLRFFLDASNKEK